MNGQPITVYVYGTPGSGKTRMLREVFGTDHGYVHRGTVRVGLLDGIRVSAFELGVFANMRYDCDYLILTGNHQPEQISMHLDHLFCLNSEEALKECRDFLNSIWGAKTSAPQN